MKINDANQKRGTSRREAKRGTFMQNVPRYFDMSRWFLATVIRY